MRDLEFANYTIIVDHLSYNYLIVNISVGTPAQKIPVVVSTRVTDDQPEGNSDLVILGDVHKSESYHWNKSRSFRKTGVSFSFYKPHGPSGWLATDNITLGTKKSHKNQNFRLSLNSTGNFSTLHLNLPTEDKPSFIRQILKGEREQVVTFSYDSVFPGYSGVISFGNRSPNRCANDWILNDAAPGDHQFMIKFDEFTVGKYTNSLSRNVSALITPNENYMVLPKDLVRTICNRLNGQFCYADIYQIYCDAAVNIKFKVMGLTLVLTPDDYLDRTEEHYNGRCNIRINKGSEHNAILPYGLLRKNCLLFDYDNFNVGLASRIETNASNDVY
ncbi:hypothetical protein M3Y95_01132700 [Aphelenchoides besseyi]|nr:hypothetical protein M3Y95_01132700 [Aphelenchoides besseyi]